MEELKVELEDFKKIMNRYPENEELKKIYTSTIEEKFNLLIELFEKNKDKKCFKNWDINLIADDEKKEIDFISCDKKK